MTKDQVLSISSLTAAQREAAERWFKVPFNKGKQINGTQTEVKAFLNSVIAKHHAMVQAKLRREKKNGTLNEVISKVKELCKGQGAAFTYKDILGIINAATEQRKAAIDEVRQLEANLKAKKAELGIK